MDAKTKPVNNEWQALHDVINAAWDALQNVPGPEAAALRELLGRSSMRHAQNMDIDWDYDWVILNVQAMTARNYLDSKRYGSGSDD